MAPCSLAVRTPLAHRMHTAPMPGYVERSALSIACSSGCRDVCTLLVGRGARLHNELEDESPAEVGRRLPDAPQPPANSRARSRILR